jgi:hypothetical protein
MASILTASHLPPKRLEKRDLTFAQSEVFNTPKGLMPQFWFFVCYDNQHRCILAQCPMAILKQAFHWRAASSSPTSQLPVGNIGDDDINIMDGRGAQVGNVPLQTGGLYGVVS